MSTSTVISGCFQPGQAKVGPGPTPLVLLFAIAAHRDFLKGTGHVLQYCTVKLSSHFFEEGFIVQYTYSIYCQARDHTPLARPAVRDLTRDGRCSTYDASAFKLSNVSFRGKFASMENTLKLQSPTKLAGLGHFPPDSQAGRPARP